MSRDHKQAWTFLEPHLALYKEAFRRVKALRQDVKPLSQRLTKEFESRLQSEVREWFTSQSAKNSLSFNYKDALSLLGLIDDFEDKLGAPLLYNFALALSPETTEKLQALDSLLFQTRSLIAWDHNTQISDPTHEALKVDSVTDYLPRGDYVVSDAALYWHFKKLSRPFLGGPKSDLKIEKLFVEPLQKGFARFAHNAVSLVENLPESFLHRLNPAEFEEALFLSQMDWLLGSEAGLLYKIREEIFGIESGYEKIFWPERNRQTSVGSAELFSQIRFHWESENKAA